MPFQLPQPIIYLITPGRTTAATTPSSEEFAALLSLVERAVEARVSLIQLREKQLLPRVLYELAGRAVELTRATETRLVINDRADLALAARADGVHLTTRSLAAQTVRQMLDARFGEREFLVGVSAHTLAEAEAAQQGGADFATFSPIFETPSKSIYGAPVGLDKLAEAALALAPFPLVALGGLDTRNAAQALRAGARGVAAIRLFADAADLSAVVEGIRKSAV